MPDHFQKTAATATEAEQMPSQGIPPQHFLHQQRQAAKPFRMSVCPVASHTRTLLGTGIMAAPEL
jgi:hypothetical protein